MSVVTSVLAFFLNAVFGSRMMTPGGARQGGIRQVEILDGVCAIDHVSREAGVDDDDKAFEGRCTSLLDTLCNLRELYTAAINIDAAVVTAVTGEHPDQSAGFTRRFGQSFADLSRHAGPLRKRRSGGREKERGG